MLFVLREKPLYAKLFKWEFRWKEVSFLGHVISSGGILVDPARLRLYLNGRLRNLFMRLEVFWVWLVIIVSSLKVFLSWLCL